MHGYQSIMVHKEKNKLGNYIGDNIENMMICLLLQESYSFSKANVVFSNIQSFLSINFNRIILTMLKIR